MRYQPPSLLLAPLLAQEEGREGLDLVLPELPELIWGAIAFVIVVVVLARVAFPALREAIERRESTIQEAVEGAARNKQEAQGLLDDYKRQLGEARSEANRIIEDARGQAEQVRKDIIARAERDAQALVARSEGQLQAERNRIVQELQGQIAEVSIELSEKIIGRSLDRGAQHELVDSYIEEVSGMGGGDGKAGGGP